MLWVHPFCFYTLFISNVRQLFAADAFFLGSLRVKSSMEKNMNPDQQKPAESDLHYFINKNIFGVQHSKCYHQCFFNLVVELRDIIQ